MPPEVHLLPPISSLVSVMTAGLLGLDTEGEIIAAGDLVDFFDMVRAWYGHDVDARFPKDTLPDEGDFDLGLSHETHFESFWVQAEPAWKRTRPRSRIPACPTTSESPGRAPMR